jgi:2-C-methyl-D-erythritol 2,4-cyclodiphosphate synthase
MTPTTGIGWDSHRLVAGRPLILGGVAIEHDLGLVGHSDADALTHAIIDALLGAAAMGDIGQHFPDTDERYRDADSMLLLRTVVATLAERGLAVTHVDATVVMERPARPYRDAIRATLADGLGVVPEHVNVKASTGEAWASWAAARASRRWRWRLCTAGEGVIAQAHLDLVLLAVLSAVSVLLIVAYHWQVPYPILS